MGNLVLLLGLVLIMGSSTSASNALSSSSFTTNNGKTAFTKHNGFGHFQDNNGKTNGQAERKNGDAANEYTNGHSANGHHNGANGKTNGSNGSNGVNPAFLPRNGNRKPDAIVEADYIADTKLPTDVGQFQLRAYRVKRTNGDEEPEHYQNTNALEPVVIYSADKPPFGKDGHLAENVPIRIHDQCLTSEVFRSQRYVQFL